MIETAAQRREMLTDKCRVGSRMLACKFDRASVIDLDIVGASYTLQVEEADAIRAQLAVGSTVAKVYPEFENAERGPYTIKVVLTDVWGYRSYGLEEAE